MSVRYRIIAGFPAYRVGDDGSVWSRYKRRATQSWIGGKWKRMKVQTRRRSGYMTVVLSRSKRKYPKYVHHLVLEAFVGPRPRGKECRHKDGRASNNRRTNLAWGTHLENYNDAVKHKTDPTGERHGNTKLTTCQVCEIRNRYIRGSVRQKDLAAEYGVTVSNISVIILNKSRVRE